MRSASVGLANGSVTQLRGQSPRAEAVAARWLPRIPLDSDTRSATNVTPRRWCSAEGLQPRTEAGPRQLQWQVSQRRMPIVPLTLPSPLCSVLLMLFPRRKYASDDPLSVVGLRGTSPNAVAAEFIRSKQVLAFGSVCKS